MVGGATDNTISNSQNSVSLGADAEGKRYFVAVGWDPTTAAEIEAGIQSRTVETEDFREGVAALLEKREPEFKGR